MLIEVDLGKALQPDQLVGVDQHRDLDAIAGHERKAFEQPTAHRDFAGQWLADLRELGGRRARAPGGPSDGSRVRRRRRGAARRPPTDGGSGPSRLHRRVEGSAGRSARSRNAHSGSAPVGVDKTDDLAVDGAQRTPHRVTLAEHRPELGIELGLLHHPGAGARATSAVPSLEAASRTTTSSIDAGPLQRENRLDEGRHGVRAFSRRQDHRDTLALCGTRAAPAESPNGGTSAVLPSARRPRMPSSPTIPQATDTPALRTSPGRR